jgi:hypothetical protein
LNTITQSAHSPRSFNSEDNVVAINSRKIQTTGPRLLYDRKEAARQLSISIRSLDYLIAAKTFQTRRVGKKILIPHGELVRFAGSNHYGRVASGG